MGRHQAFDRQQVLHAVMHIFREQGYKATSLKDLEQVSGLNPSSLYNSFGSKKALFLECLSEYNREIVEKRIAFYMPEQAGIAGVKALFHSVLVQPEGKVKGCLLTNSATEFAGTEPKISAIIQAGLKLLEQGFLKALQQHFFTSKEQTIGEEPKHLDETLNRLAMQILAFYQGILVLARLEADNPMLPIMIDDFFDSLLLQQKDN